MTTGVASAYTAYGLDLQSEFELPGAWPDRVPGSTPVELRLVELATVTATFSGRSDLGWRGLQPGGRIFTCEIGTAGDHLFSYGEEAWFHLSADGRVLSCAATDPSDLNWKRVLLDSVLFSVALLSGRDALHCGAVAVASGALAVAGGSGVGKSTLTAALLRQGAELVTDDVLAIDADASRLLLHGGPPTMNLASDVGLGTTIAVLDDEVWTAVPVVVGPLPLVAVVLLERRIGARLALEPVTDALAVLPHLLAFPRERARERFNLACDIAAAGQLWRLTADTGVAPDVLARTIAREFG